jgi:uncharacterized tellurite resistance protein B-like protein
MTTAFKYNKEDLYFKGDESLGLKGVGQRLADLMASSDYNFKGQMLANEMRVHDLTRPAIRVDNLHFVQDINKRIEKLLDEEIETNFYVLRMTNPNAHATSKQSFLGDKSEFIIILSQHFFNDLSFDEQTALIAHEVAHFKYEHTTIPYGSIVNRLSYAGNSLDDRIFLDNLKKWSICKEISADLFALQTTRNYEATALALIKFTTGIMQNAGLVLSDLEDQFRKFTSSRVTEILKEHPMTLLRIKILKAVATYLNDNGWKDYDDKVQTIIDNQVKLIYPEILFEDNTVKGEIVFEMGIAVIAADGKINDEEVNYLKQITHYHQGISNRFQGLVKAALKDLFEFEHQGKVHKQTKHKLLVGIVDHRLKNAKRLAKELKPREISVIVRHLLQIAAADGKVESCELEVIYRFAKHFNYTKTDIVQQMFNLK